MHIHTYIYIYLRTDEIERVKYIVFAEYPVGGETLQQITQQNARAFNNRTSRRASDDIIKLVYAWITCQEVNQVK